MKNKTEKLRPFHMRIPMDVWESLKLASMQEEISMSQVINNLVRKYKSKEKLLKKLDKYE